MRTVFFILPLSTLLSAQIEKTQPPGRVLALQTHALINQERKNLSIANLDWNETLAQLALIHSQNMANQIVGLGHDGFKSRIAEAKKSLEIGAAAENVFYAS